MQKDQQNLVGWKDMVLRLTVVILMITFAAVLSAGLMAQRRSKSKPRGSSAIKVVKTKIPVGYKAGIAASDDIIVFGTGFNTGVEYVSPRDAASGKKIPNGDQYSSKFFAASGSKIVLAKPNDFTIAVFDTATGRTNEIPESTLKLRSIGGSMYKGGSIQMSGNYAVVITDTGGSDNSAIKVIDVSGAEPKVVRFEGSGPDSNTTMVFRQVAIDAKSGMVAAVEPIMT